MPEDEYTRGMQIGKLIGTVSALVPQVEEQNKHVGQLFSKLEHQRKEHDLELRALEIKTDRRMDRVETTVALLATTVDTHVKDPNTHFNPYFNETTGQRLMRKKKEILAGGATGTGIVALIMFAIRYLGANA